MEDLPPIAIPSAQVPNSPVVPSPQIEYASPPTQSKSSVWKLLIAIIASLFLGIAGYFAFKTYSKTTTPALVSNQDSPISVVAPQLLKNFTPMPDSAQLLAYIKDADPEKYGDEKIVLINPNTKIESTLPIEKVSLAFKYYGSDLLFYHPQNDKGEFHILNLKSGLDQTYDLLDHTDKSTSVSVSVNNITEISPDGNYLVFNGSFFSPCPSPSPFPSGFEGGFGPCGPEESLDNPTGYFLYDFKNKKSTYLKVNTFRVSRWDMPSNKLYYIDYDNNNTTKSLDLVSKTVSFVDSSNNFGYFVYPLITKDQIVKFEAATGNSGSSAFGKLYLLKNSDQSETEIDNTNTWTDLQPFVTANQSESDVLYRRSININGIHSNSIYRYKISDGKSSRISKDDNSLSYSNYVSWINDHEIVTSVDEMEEQNYSNNNQYLVKINLNTLQETRLTDHDEVRSFNSQ